MELRDRSGYKVVSKDDPVFKEVCELLELDPEEVDYLLYEDFEEMDYTFYDEFDEYEDADAWQPENRMIEVYYLDGSRDEIEIELDSELDEVLKRLLG